MVCMYGVQRWTSDLANKFSIETLLIQFQLGFLLLLLVIRSLYSLTVQAEILMDGNE